MHDTKTVNFLELKIIQVQHLPPDTQIHIYIWLYKGHTHKIQFNMQSKCQLSKLEVVTINMECIVGNYSVSQRIYIYNLCIQFPYLLL